MTGVFINVLFGSGLRAPAAPGSIIAIYAQTASGSFPGVTLSVLGRHRGVVHRRRAFLLKTDKATEEPDLAAATASMESMKGKKSSVAVGTGGRRAVVRSRPSCSPAMRAVGSSAMGASVLRKKIQQAGFGDVKVTNAAISNLTDTFDLVVTPS